MDKTLNAIKMKKTITLLVMTLFVFAQIQAQVHYQNTQTNNTNSSAIGYGTVASGEKSFASGLTSTAQGVGSTTMGIDNLAIGDYSITLGSNLKAQQGHSIVIGSGYSNYFRLTNNNTYSLMVGFLSQYPTLFVGTSPAYDKTGSIGIGNVVDENGYMDPQAKLHLRADEGEEAAMFIEPHSWESGDKVLLYLGNKQNGIQADITEGMVYTTEEHHIFKGGDVYIEDIDKGIIMKSPDGKCWRGTLNNNGSLQFILLEACPGTTTSLPEKTGQKTQQIKLYPNPASDFINVTAENPEGLKATIIDENGRALVSKPFTQATIRFYTGDLPIGNYLIKVTGKGMQVSKKFVKNR